MRRLPLVIFTVCSALYQIPVFADADMFRPFEPYLEATPDQNEGLTWESVNREHYRVVRDRSGSWFTKQDYHVRHCGSAYINCQYPDQDYPRYNGPVYFPPRR